MICAFGRISGGGCEPQCDTEGKSDDMSGRPNSTQIINIMRRRRVFHRGFICGCVDETDSFICLDQWLQATSYVVRMGEVK